MTTTTERSEANRLIRLHFCHLPEFAEELVNSLRLKECVTRNIENVEANITSFQLFYENIKSMSTIGDKGN